MQRYTLIFDVSSVCYNRTKYSKING